MKRGEKRGKRTKPHNNQSNRERSNSALVINDPRNAGDDKDDVSDKRYGYSYADCGEPAQVRVRDVRS
jgi:hypothetical protein